MYIYMCVYIYIEIISLLSIQVNKINLIPKYGRCKEINE